MINSDQILWSFFGITVAALMALDLGIFHKKSHQIGIREAMIWSVIWLAVAAVFNIIIYLWHGPDTALEFTAAYIVERSLSIDNLFVFLLIFSYFKVPSIYQYRVLFWGILAALILRGIFIISGIELILHFHWIIYAFGAFLIYTGLKISMSKKDEEVDLSRNKVLRLCRRFLPMVDEYDGGSFLVRNGGKLMATPLLAVLLVIETSDLIFAIDSVPAVLGITLNPFVAYTSNIFAILGLRALYFALAGSMLMFHYLNQGITVVLIFIGIKMLISGIYEVPVIVTLGVIALVLIGSILLSIAMPKARETQS